MLARLFAIIPCLVIAWCTAVSADVLVLQDGRRINGILSNRELVRDDPGAFREISFLVGTGPQAVLRRFATVEIEWILIEGRNPSVIDFEHLAMRSPGVPQAFPAPRKEKVTLYLDLKGGFTWARFHSDDSDVLRDYRNGHTFGICLTTLKGDYFGMSLGANYVQKGAVDTETSGTGRVAQLEFRMDYIEIPVLVIGRIPMGQHALRAFAGPALAYRVSAKVIGEGWTWFPGPEQDGELDISDETSNLDVGWRAGVGLEFDLTGGTRLLIEGNYARTISPFNESTAIDWTHGVVSAEVGLSIALNRNKDDEDSRESTRPRWGRR